MKQGHGVSAVFGGRLPQHLVKTFIHGPKIIFVLQQKVFSQMTLPDRREGVRFTDN